IASCAMSNHHHTVIFDPKGRYPEFLENFHRLTARAMNLVRDKRKENFWASQQVNVVRLDDYAAVLEKICYTFVNPVRHCTVSHERDWPGFHTYKLLRYGQTMTVERPRFFFRKVNDNKRLPPVIKLAMTLPEELLGNRTREAFFTELDDRLEFAREHWLREHKADKRTPIGKAAVLAQSWRGYPVNDPNHPNYAKWRERRNAIKPTRATKDKDKQRDGAVHDDEFQCDYREARALMLDGKPCVFPYGTYWHRRFNKVKVARRRRGDIGPYCML
ncbi:MAG TPA: hypothetical protein VFQ53_16385, partial [Kofleriaceae bacterium]|nr:hypothetical protein [Kofleriaceae bacterium]